MITKNFRYWFLSWNLLLAWLPLLIAMPLSNALRARSWVSPIIIGLAFLWLVFLPNSFYLITDYIHLSDTAEVPLLFDVVMFSSFAFCGFLLGYVALSLVHDRLERRLHRRRSLAAVLTIVLLISFAIYLGRYLRWNSWDVIINPVGLIIDIVNRLVNPTAHAQTYVTTGLFFILITSYYFSVRSLVRAFGKK